MISIPIYFLLILLGTGVWIFSVVNGYDQTFSFAIIVLGIFEGMFGGDDLIIGNKNGKRD